MICVVCLNTIVLKNTIECNRKMICVIVKWYSECNRIYACVFVCVCTQTILFFFSKIGRSIYRQIGFSSSVYSTKTKIGFIKPLCIRTMYISSEFEDPCLDAIFDGRVLSWVQYERIHRAKLWKPPRRFVIPYFLFVFLITHFWFLFLITNF